MRDFWRYGTWVARISQDVQFELFMLFEVQKAVLRNLACPPKSHFSFSTSELAMLLCIARHAWDLLKYCRFQHKRAKPQPRAASAERIRRQKSEEGKGSVAQSLACWTSSLKILSSNRGVCIISGVIYIYTYIYIHMYIYIYMYIK